MQQSSRRAWGAPKLPKPAAERRAEVEAVPPAAEAAAAAPQLPRLAGATASPRGKPSPLRSCLAPHERLKQRLATQQRPAAEAAPALPPGPAVLHQLPGSEPDASVAGAAAQSDATAGAAAPAAPSAGAWLPPASLQSREDEDAVLIGSCAPSFSQPARGAEAPCAAARQPGAAQPATGASPPPRRPSFLSAQLGSEDLSLTALAAASRRGTAHSCSPRSLPSTAGSGGGSGGLSLDPSSAAPLPAAEDGGYVPDWEDVDSPGAGASLPAGQPAGRAVLSSDELALLRTSLLELGVGATSASALAAASDGAGSSQQAAAAMLVSWSDGDIPDQVVLQELSSRLGRLDSQKRRVLLEVLAKIDGMDGGAPAGSTTSAPPAATGAGESSAAAAASQLIAESLGSSRRSSRAASSAEMQAVATLPLPAGSATAGQQQQQSPSVPQPVQQQQEPDVAGPPAPQPAPQQEPDKQHQAAPVLAPAPASPTKQGGIMGKLAALRLGRSNSQVGKQSAAAATAAGAAGGGAAAAPAAMPAVPQQAAPPQLPKPVASKPQAMVPSRGSSRLSADSATGGQLQQQGGPRASQAPASSHGPSGGDALAAFEQQLAAAAAEQEHQPSGLEASPTALVLHAFEQADALDASGLPAAAAAASPHRRTSAGSSGRAGSGGEEFCIPRCPAGRLLELRIRSTWGDPHYVGLSGLELFDSQGRPLTVRDPLRQVSARPASINDLPEYSSDPRTADKLVDGVVMTCDDRHMWLAPFTPGGLHTVALSLDAPATLGALRVWNYNKSRVGSLRGARHVEVMLDGARIFQGEVQQAPGSVAGALQHAELILFTDDPAALVAIEQHDQRYALRQLSPPGSKGSMAGTAAAPLDLVTGGASPAPLSARGQLERTATLPVLQPLQPGSRPPLGSGGRPPTSALGSLPLSAAGAAGWPSSGSCSPLRGSTAGCRHSAAAGSPVSLLHCRELTLLLLDSWGDSHFIGLSGLQVLGADRQPLPLAPAQLAADPPDLNVFPGHSGDVRTVDKLVDGISNTMDDTHMWLAPIRRQLGAAVVAACQRQRQSQQQSSSGGGAGVDRAALPEAARPYNVLQLRLAPGGSSAPVAVSGLRLWNYNKSSSDTGRGVKRIVVLADGVEVSPPGGIIVRRAPGTAAFDFGQYIPLSLLWAPSRAGAARNRGSTLHHGRHQGAASGAHGADSQQQQQQLVVHSESLAWVCSLPDPAAAMEYLQRAALMAKAAGPGGGLVGQPGENFGTPLPCGFSLKLVLLSSWGDSHYIGLSAIEVRDAVRGPLPIRGGQVFASPASVALLPGLAADVRTPDKLVDGNASGAPQHSWLAPLDGQEGNVVRLTLDAPVLLGSLKVWNYARTPARGVQELELYLDEHLVWKGVLQRAPAEVAPGQDFGQTLCFCEEAAQEAAAAARRRAAAAARSAKAAAGGSGTPGIAGAAAAASGLLPGTPLGAEGVEEWAQRQERVVLFNNGLYVAFPPDGGARLPDTARPITALVAA